MSEHKVKHVTPASGNVFADLGFDPVEAANLKLRAELALALTDWAKAHDLKQKALAEVWGVSQGRVSNLMNGKLHLFSLDMLVTFAAKSGLKTELVVEAA